jgi:C terminal of Calcineurin-like phosphoesterase/N terminal of Calcineurin-like phosphoesterase
MLRRSFVRKAGAAAAALVLPERLLADPYAWLDSRALGGLGRINPPSSPTRVRGRVQVAGRGLANVGVTDGFATVTTDRDGRYTLLAHPRARFASVRLPAGFKVPLTQTGTARLHQPIPQTSRREAEASFSLDRLGVDDSRHAFLLLADTQTQNAFEMGRLHAETVPDVKATVRSLDGRPVFGVACGDIMYDDLSLYPEYERAVAASGVPFFQVVGNHDLDFKGQTDEATIATFESHFGPGHYSFDRGEVHYVVLDDVLWHGTGYVGYLDADQLAWLGGDLALVEAGRTVVVFLHIPVARTRPERTHDPDGLDSTRVNNREALYRLLEPYRAHVLTGHTHEHEHIFTGGVHEHVHGTVCGAWWSGDICWDGTPNGYGVYEVAGSELRWRYKASGRPSDHQLRVYQPGADPTAPTDLVANVWDWDPKWTVVWYEAGDRRGAMSRRIGLDPLSVKAHTGPTLPPRRTWVEPSQTEHMFYAATSAGARDVKVEVTDRWGRVYSAAPGS